MSETDIALPTSRLSLRHLAKSVGSYTVTSMLTRAAPLLILPVLSHWLSPAELGSSALFIALVSLFVPFVGMRSDAAFVSGLGEPLSAETGLYDTVLALPLLITIGVAALVSLAALARIPLGQMLGLRAGWIIAAAGISLLAVYFYDYLSMIQYHGRILQYSIIQFAVAFSTLGLTSLLIIVFFPNAVGRNLGYAIPLGVAGLMSVWQMTRHFRPRLRITRAGLRRLSLIALPLIGSTVASILMSTTDRFAIVTYQGRTAVGYYAFGVSLGLAIAAVNESFYAAWVPAVIKHFDGKHPRSHLLRAVFLFFCGICAFAAFYYAALPLIIHLANPDGRYARSLVIARATVMALLGKGVFNMLEAVLVFERSRPRLTLLTNCSMAVVAPVAIFLLARIEGPVGPQHAILAIYFVAASFYAFLALRPH